MTRGNHLYPVLHHINSKYRNYDITILSQRQGNLAMLPDHIYYFITFYTVFALVYFSAKFLVQFIANS